MRVKDSRASRFLLFPRHLWIALGNLVNKGQIEISGYVAYASFLALFPFIIILMGVMAIFGASEQGEETLAQFYQLLPTEVVETISPVMSALIHAHHQPIFTLSVVGMVWISSSGVEALRAGLNNAYEVKDPRSVVWRRGQSILFILLLVIAIFTATLLMVLFPLGFSFVTKYVPDLLEISSFLLIVRYGATFFLLFLVFTFVYWVLPCANIRLKQCVPGAFIATALWMVGANLFSIYLKNVAQYNVIYGSIGGVVITLLFFHLTALVTLYGAELNRSLRESL